MVDGLRNREDIEFAHSTGGQLAGDLSSIRPIRRTYSQAPLGSDELIGRVAALVRGYLGPRYQEPPRDALAFFDSEIDDVRTVLDRGGSDVLVLTEAGNAFGLDVVVDIFNARARRGISGLSRGPLAHDLTDDSSEPPPPPPLSPDWLQSVELSAAPIRRVHWEEAARSFVTLFTDAFRMAASPGRAGFGAPRYEANANRKGWILECWPQFHYSPKRFGSVMTWPVHDTLPVSGDYMFQGLKGAQISKDPSPHYFGPTRTSTIVQL